MIEPYADSGARDWGKVYGYCAPGYESIRRRFARNFEEFHEQGAGFSVYRKGVLVVELWGGTKDRAHREPWERNTLVNVFSVTKGVTALCALQLIEQGLLELETPVSQYWPEFAANGKADLPVSLLFNHRAGLPALRSELPPEAIFDWDHMTSALAFESPWWQPGSRQGYHAFTFGWLVGELIRRLSGCSVGQYLRQAIAEPLGLDLAIGLDASQLSRVADVARLEREDTTGDCEEGLSLRDLDAKQGVVNELTSKTFTNPPSLSTGTNSRAWRASEIPAANGHATAAALARLYGCLANAGALDGVRLVQEESMGLCHQETSCELDTILQVPMRFSTGFMLSNTKHPHMHLGRGSRCFGHSGAGGSIGFADPDYGLGFGYITNRLGSRTWMDRRARTLIEAVYDVLPD